MKKERRSSANMAGSILAVAVLLSCALLQTLAVDPTLPSVSDDYTAAMQFASITTGFADEWFEARDYEGNRLLWEHTRDFTHIFRYDKGFEWNITGQYSCATLSVQAMLNSTKGHAFLPAYDPTTGHLRTSNDEFNLNPSNYTFVKNETINGISAMTFTAFFDVPGGVNSTCTNPSPMPPGFQFRARNVYWHFSADDATFYNMTVKNIPLRAYQRTTMYDCIGGHYTQNTTFEEVLTFLDYHPGRPDWHVFEARDTTLCAELNQTAKQIPVLPTVFAHITEHAEYPRQAIDYFRFVYNYDANMVKFSGWRPGGYIDVIQIDVNKLQVYNFTFNPVTQEPPTCTIQAPNRTDNFSFISQFIDFTANPPHLVRFTESFIVNLNGSASINWLYAGHKPVRSVWSEIWFQAVNFTTFNPHHFDHIAGYDAWAFAGDDWNVVGLNETRVALAFARYGIAWNGTFIDSSTSVNYSDFRSFTEQQYGTQDPHEFDIPFFCPGGGSGFRPGESGMLSTNGMTGAAAVSLSFGMVLVGIIIGGFITHLITRRKSSVAYEANPSQQSYGSNS